MNLVLLFPEDFVEAERRAAVAGRRGRHVRDVHRVRIGDTLRVGLANGPCGHGLVTAVTDDRVELDVLLDQPPPAPLPATVLLALPRPKTLKKVLQTVAAMGVKRLVLLQTWRVEKSFWQSPLLQEAALRAQLVLGLEQGADTVLPEVLVRRRFKPFVEDELRALAHGTLALVAHPPAPAPCPRAAARPVTLAIGPEGGFIPYEVERLGTAGFTPVSLGPRPLRVEQAVPALLGRLF